MENLNKMPPLSTSCVFFTICIDVKIVEPKRIQTLLAGDAAYRPSICCEEIEKVPG